MMDGSKNLRPPAAAISAPRLPAAVDRATFQAELDTLRGREKAHTREGDAIAAARRRLPMVEVDGRAEVVGPDGPVVIDFPQVVSAAGNNAARTMLLRDVNNLTASLGRWAPDLLDTWFGEEMWALFEAGELQPDTVLTGHFTFDERTVDLDGVRDAINDARELALIRQQGREEAQYED